MNGRVYMQSEFAHDGLPFRRAAVPAGAAATAGTISWRAAKFVQRVRSFGRVVGDLPHIGVFANADASSQVQGTGTDACC